MILEIILSATTIVCAVGWLKRYISCAAIIVYIQKKRYDLPSDREMKECTDFVVKHMLDDLSK